MHLILCRICKFIKHNSRQITQQNKPPWNVLFFGTDEFSLQSLKVLNNSYRNGNIIKNLEVVTNIKNKINKVKHYAEKEHLPLHDYPVNISNGVFDVGLVVSFGHLIPENIINKFQFGMLNVHASLLPRWRGAAPIIYAIASGDKQTGITIMQIKPKKFDVGDIIMQKTIDITDNMKMPEVYSKLADLGATCLLEVLEKLPENIKNARRQPENDVTLAPRVNANFAVIDWNKMTSKEIYNLERAVTGIFNLTTKWNDIPVKLYEVTRCDNLNYNNDKIKPGFTIYEKTKNTLLIKCCDNNWIEVKKIRVLGKKPMSAKDFNNGFINKVHINDRFFK